MRGLSPFRPPPPHDTPSLFFFVCSHLFPHEKKIHLFHSLSILSRCLQKKSTTEPEPIFLRFSRHHCEADLERETGTMHGEQVLKAIKETEISNKASLFLFLFRWVYFLSKANVKNRTKIRDRMPTWLKRVTAFRSHAKGHAILGNLRTTTTAWSTTTGGELHCTAQSRLVNFVVLVSSTMPNKVESRRPAIHKLRQV